MVGGGEQLSAEEVSAVRGPGQLVGGSPALRKVSHQIKPVAQTDATALITGESGTDKELVARTIHKHSRRRERPMIAVNCGAVPEGFPRAAGRGFVQRYRGEIGRLALGGPGPAHRRVQKRAAALKAQKRWKLVLSEEKRRLFIRAEQLRRSYAEDCRLHLASPSSRLWLRAAPGKRKVADSGTIMTPAILISSDYNQGFFTLVPVQLAALAALEGVLYWAAVLTRLSLLAGARGWRRQIGTLSLAFVPRLMVWLGLCGLYGILAGSFGPNSGVLRRSDLPLWRERFVLIVSLLCGLSLIGRLLYLANRRLRMDAAADATHWERILAVLGGESLQIGLPLAAAYFILPLLGLSASGEAGAWRLINLVLVGAVGYVLIRLVNLAADKATLGQAQLNYFTSLRARTLYTQVAVLRRMALVVIGFVTLASMLLFFQPVRQLGASLLASAGVLGVIAGVAAQRSLANLVAGFQIAVTQPILLEDVVTVEGEYGQIEEITLTYVVVRLWDLRRLVLPISYFLEKPFLNWTRTSPELVGTVFLRVDLLAPLDVIEAEFERVLAADPRWNKHKKGFVLYETHERSLELRLTVSANDPDQLFDLRAAVRRAVMDFLRREHPHALPRLRAEMRSHTFDDEAISPGDTPLLPRRATDGAPDHGRDFAG